MESGNRINDEELERYQKHISFFFNHFNISGIQPDEGMMILMFATCFAFKNMTSMDENNFIEIMKESWKVVMDHKTKDDIANDRG